ncbi:MAG TPA: hypothetical protein VNG12_03390 [Acidimicrobiales bacterium]|nr:hypothetical protein [Acidimicrobiales bacterium]
MTLAFRRLLRLSWRYAVLHDVALRSLVYPSNASLGIPEADPEIIPAGLPYSGAS